MSSHVNRMFIKLSGFILIFVCLQHVILSRVLQQPPEPPISIPPTYIIVDRNKTFYNKNWQHHYPIHLQPRLSFTHKEQSEVLGSKPPEVFHRCTCSGTPGNVKNIAYNWMHIPKTGTSFVIPFWDLALQGLNVDYNFDNYYGVYYGISYDLALQERYPLELYATNASLLASHHTRHLPIDESLGHDYVTLFRDPSKRVLSAFNYNMLSDGLTYEEYVQLIKQCNATNPMCYSNFPGISHCMTKMLVGHKCSENVEVDTAKLEKAKQNLENLSFIGIVEEWNETVCQFYKTFGGVPNQGSFTNVNAAYQTMKNKKLEASFLRSYRDDFDQEIYNLAKKEFQSRYLSKNKRCYKEERTLDESTKCWPTNCENLGKQCGEWPDGCGGVLVCGVCPLQRLTLPSSWRVECSPEGQCLHTCPFWVQSGIWFSHDVAGLVDQLELQSAPYDIEINEFMIRHMSYMPPSDAIWICGKACESSKKSQQRFAKEFCVCGERPLAFLRESPSAESYLKTMDLKPRTKITKSQPYNASRLLKKIHSQPLCCHDRAKTDFGEEWKEGMVAAEYFSTYDLGCRDHTTCAKLGIKLDAEAVVFCRATNLCHLARNVRNHSIFGSNNDKAGKWHRIL
mmetsp:Transcript_25902/g.38274  ORF Transcript_25902/g.38274 Transcript_25902/m.38274 type:complete len:623 (+) Transcript_25902:136-2004(+)